MKLFTKKNQKQPVVVRRRLSDATASESGQRRAIEANASERYSFRRNRTLTGSLVSGVGSATERTAELKSPRVQAHDLRKHRRKLSWLFGVSLASVVLLGYLVYQSIAIVHVRSLSADASIANTQAYAALIKGYFASHPFERFRFSLNTVGLADYLQANGAPEVKSVSKQMSYDGFGASELQLEFRRPVVSWETGRKQVYVDATGAAFERNYYREPSVRVEDKSGIATRDNQVVASSRFLGFMGKIIGRMQENGLTVRSITLPFGTSRQVEVLTEGHEYPIRFSTDRPAGEQSEDAARSVRYLAAQGIVPQYIDVRVGGKAYYK